MNWDEKLLPYEQAAKELAVKFDCISSQFNKLGLSSPIVSVEHRVKGVSSIMAKAKRKGIAIEDIEEKMEDISGIRIICRFVEDIDRVVNLVKKRDGLDLELLQERDYVSNMKVSGYRSYHLIVRYPVIMATGEKKVFCEIQIRTLAMNFWAVIEHSLRYKYDKKIPEDIHRRLIRSADAAFMLDKEVSVIRDDILAAEKSSRAKENIVTEIISNIQALYRVAEIEQVDNLNKKFMIIYDGNDEDQLLEFGRQVKVMAELYKIR